ncbi:MAG: hypothetical protein BJ554DRAFT_6203 [Olpidium bornovanus]|uniref:Secreted protein n=1 Tax=Olpidium bornovanus TaxID=278681 RepID=A0A8H7ZZ03_9FUNG|nr:MAG: hypothetical protein BJ554DRAFT_6203 [Olpidium bornovanus]
MVTTGTATGTIMVAAMAIAPATVTAHNAADTVTRLRTTPATTLTTTATAGGKRRSLIFGSTELTERRSPSTTTVTSPWNLFLWTTT